MTQVTTKARLPRRPLRGATLIELMVALSLLAVVLSVTVGLVAGMLRNGARVRARAELSRQGEFVNTILTNELRMAGFGVPPSTGTHIDDAYAGPGATAFASYVILATSTAVGVVGDFPRPDAQYSTYGVLANRPGGGRDRVMWHTENNGSCAPNTIGPSCNTGNTSVFFPRQNGCSSTSSVNDRTCPWGMKRARAGERIQVVSGAGRWTHAGVSSPMSMTSFGAAGQLSLMLSTSWNVVWPNTAASDPPVAVSGQGYVTTIDRVFYRLNGTDLERIQCWGDPDPGSSNWPNLATNTMPALASLAVTPTGGVQNECTAPEVVAKNVASLSFTYLDGAGAVTTNKAQIRRIDWALKLSKSVQQRSVEQDVVGTAALRN
jgi:prepilin-type N-terminal cleavage/methylation domain-containing protein